jgi:hypothetical protein
VDNPHRMFRPETSWIQIVFKGSRCHPVQPFKASSFLLKDSFKGAVIEPDGQLVDSDSYWFQITTWVCFTCNCFYQTTIKQTVH